MTQHLTEEEIAICADALNTGGYRDLPAHLREHLAQCDQCAGEVLMVAEVAGEFDFKAEYEKQPEKEKTQRIIAWSVSVAAAVALILLIIDQEINPFEEDQLLSKNSTTEQIIKSTETEEQSASGEESVANKENKSSDQSETSSRNISGDSEFPAGSAPATSAPAPRNDPDTLKFLAQYTPNENLEKLVNRFEGSLRNNGDIIIKSPLKITTTESSLVIKWENPGKKRLIIEVLDNQGEKIIEAETDQEEYTLNNLNDGLYYWKLISGTDFDLLFCGKIIVE